MALKKPSDFFQKPEVTEEVPQTTQKTQEFVVSSSISESFEKFKDNIGKLDALNETVQSFSESLSNKVDKSELENAMMSHLMILDENFKTFKKQIRGLNKKDLSEIYQAVEELVNYIEDELPKYKKSITSSELKVGVMFSDFKEELQEDILSIKGELSDKVSLIEENLIESNKQIQEAYSAIKETSDTYNKLFETVEHKALNEERIIKDYSSLIENLQSEVEDFKTYIKDQSDNSVNSLSALVEEKVSLIEEDVNKKLSQLNELKQSLDEEITSIKTDVVINEKHLKKIENYIQENHKELVEIREEVFSEIEKLSIGNLEANILKLQDKIDFIKETYSQINTEDVVREVLKEGLLNEPPSTDNSDPLTPLDKNYVTLEQLQQHYRLFINRIQQQISTIGGGGETRLEFLDDIDRASAKVDGKFLKYDSSIGKWVGATGGGGGSQTLDITLGLGNTSTLGMSVGISTFNNVIVGGATTDLLVNGDARITGILTIGTASVTIDGTANKVNVGSATTISVDGFNIGNSSVHSSGITVGVNTLHTSGLTVNNLTASGIITATAFVGSVSGTASNATYANTAGIATYATSAGIATYAEIAGISTALQNPRTFQITGDIVSTTVSFDGTGNVSLAATIQPNSVGLGTDTTGDYIQSISGTANQVTISNGTGEGSTPIVSIPNQFIAPQDVTVTRDLLVNRDLNVNGNITIGGTSATLFTSELKVADPDIVLGIRTDSNNNDVSTDNTANHGGVAIASTEGTPLVDLYIAGIETNPATYKKFMWFKQGTFAGLGTDAWLSNYAIGIGSTQFPSGTRLAIGNVQFNQNDLFVVRNINSSGVITATTFIPSSGYIKAPDGTNSFYIYSGTGDVAFQGKINTSQINSASGYKALDFGSTTTPSVNITNSLNVGSGVSVVGVVTASSFSGNASSATYANTAGIATYANTAGIATYATSAGIATSVNSGTAFVTQLQVTGVSTFTNGPVFVGSATTTGTASQLLQVTGGGYVSGNLGVGTTNPGESIDVLGKMQIRQNAGSNNRLIFRGTPGSSYRWNIDNFQSGNSFRIFREDDATAANGFVAVSISTTGTISATSFVGDGSQLTGIVASGSGVVVQNQGSTVGTATTINFSTNLTATFSNGTATITASGSGTATASIDILEAMLFV